MISSSSPRRTPAEVQDTQCYARSIQTAVPEAASDQGLLFEEQAGGQVKVLKTSGQTTPDPGPKGQTDIPPDAVSNGRVVLYVDGIQTGQAEEQAEIQGLLESTDARRTNVHQPVIGIQEGVGANVLSDGARIGMDFELLKGLQSHVANTAWVQQAAYAIDPAVKTIHDEIRQSLEVGRNVQLVAHSGGGAEVALALTLLQQEDGGRFASAITQHVRVLGLAPAAAPEDFTMAGVKAANLYYTGSQQDSVWQLFHQFVPAGNQAGFVLRAVQALQTALTPSNIDFHSPFFIYDHNVAPNGTSEIQPYLDGGPGQINSF